MKRDHPVTRRSALRSLAGLSAVGILAGCSGPTGGGNAQTVDMTGDLTFAPQTITVSTGTTVTWDNVSNLAHSVTAYADEIPDDAAYFASGGADSEEQAREAYPDTGEIPAGETYEHSFEVAGSYGYFCIPHESAGMTGTVEVTAD